MNQSNEMTIIDEKTNESHSLTLQFDFEFGLINITYNGKNIGCTGNYSELNDFLLENKNTLDKLKQKMGLSKEKPKVIPTKFDITQS